MPGHTWVLRSGSLVKGEQIKLSCLLASPAEDVETARERLCALCLGPGRLSTVCAVRFSGLGSSDLVSPRGNVVLEGDTRDKAAEGSGRWSGWPEPRGVFVPHTTVLEVAAGNHEQFGALQYRGKWSSPPREP